MTYNAAYIIYLEQNNLTRSFHAIRNIIPIDYLP